MRSKKVGFFIAVIIMSITIIGLSIGMVLVAGRVSLGNSMIVVYKAKNVEATIVTSAKYYKTDTDTEPTAIKFLGTDLESQTQIITDTTNQADLVANTFEEKRLGAYGYAVYSFVITNNTAANNETNKLSVEIITSAPTADANINSVLVSSTISIADAFNKAKQIEGNKITLGNNDVSLLSAQQTVYYVVVLSVNDYLKDAQLLSHTMINLTATSNIQ